MHAFLAVVVVEAVEVIPAVLPPFVNVAVHAVTVACALVPSVAVP